MRVNVRLYGSDRPSVNKAQCWVVAALGVGETTLIEFLD